MSLSLERVVKKFGGQTVVDGATLDVASGEIIALLGPSGCGKTTTLRLVAGFETPDSGTIRIGGEDTARLPAYQRGIGLVFQDYALFPHMTVFENIGYGMRRQGIGAAARVARVDELLRLVRLEGLGARRPAALSGGQQQRVALARALAISPRLLLLDEPLSNLDAKLREDLRAELREILRSLKLTTLVVTHDQLEAIGLADRIAVMNKGVIVQIGTARDIYDAPQTRFVADFIGRSLWFEGRYAETGGGPEFQTREGLVLKVAKPTRPSAQSMVSIRPEHVHLPAWPDDGNRLQATLDRVEFFGAELLLHCTLAATGTRISVPVRSDSPDLPEVGQTLTLGIAAERCRVVAIP